MSLPAAPTRHLLLLPLLICASLVSGCSGDESGPPIVLEAETFTGTQKDPDYGTAAASGWAVYSRPDYSNAQAALTTKAGAIMSSPVPEFRQGNYEAEVTVYHYGGTERNSFEIELGGVRQRVSFGGPDFPRAGMVQLSRIYFENAQNNVLTIRSMAIGQLYLIVDTVSVATVDGAVPKVQEAWMK